MKKFQKQVKQRIYLYSVLLILALMMMALLLLDIIDAQNEFLASFQFGVLFGLCALFLFQIIVSVRCVRNETFCKKRYCIENDERRQMIRMKSGASLAISSSILLLFLAVIGGHYHMYIFYSLCFSSIVIIYSSVLLKLYYSRKY